MLYIFLFAILFSFIIGLAVWAIMEVLKYKKPISKNIIVDGNCKKTRWGCCPDNLIPKYDQMGTNCIDLTKHKQNSNKKNVSNKLFDKSNIFSEME